MEKRTQTKCAECKTKCFISEHCKPDCLSTIDSRKNQVWYKKGQYIFYEGTIVFGVHLITHGKVKLVNTGPKEQIVRLASDGDVLGLGHWGNKDHIYTASAVAMEDSLVCFIKNEDFLEAGMTNPKLTLNLLAYNSNELRRTQFRIRILSQLGTKERVIETLNYLIDIFGLQTQKGISLDLSRQEIADLARTTPTQVSRELAELKRELILKTEDKKLIISDLDKLQEMARIPYHYLTN